MGRKTVDFYTLLDYNSYINKYREVKFRVMIPTINAPNFKE